MILCSLIISKKKNTKSKKSNKQRTILNWKEALPWHDNPQRKKRILRGHQELEYLSRNTIQHPDGVIFKNHIHSTPFELVSGKSYSVWGEREISLWTGYSRRGEKESGKKNGEEKVGEREPRLSTGWREMKFVYKRGLTLAFQLCVIVFIWC